MVLINMLDIAQQLELHNQEAHYDIDDDTFDLVQGKDNADDEVLMNNLSFKELAMYATGLATEKPDET